MARLCQPPATRCAGIKRAVRESRPKVLFLTSPNNPDGSMIAEADLLELLALPVCVLSSY